MSYSIIKNSLDTLILPLGSSFLHPNTETSLIEEKLIITPKKEYGFWSRKLLKALNSGLITQLVYDAIKDNENEEKQYYTISLAVALSNSVLLSIIEPFRFEFINTEETALNILKVLNENGYQLIKK